MDTVEKKHAFYSISDISEKLSVSQKTIRRHIASGKLESTKIGTTYRIAVDALESFINSNSLEEGNSNKYDIFGKEIIEEENTKIEKRKSVNYKNNPNDDVNWVDIIQDWESPKKSELTFVDLFSGAGGITKGFELAGLNGVCGLDWFEAAGKTYRRNFDHPFVEGDIKLESKKKEFYDTVKKQLNGRKLNVVAGGFPCQGFSMAGNRIVEDPRNSLYKDLLEIVIKLNPEFVVCENVVGLRSMLKGRVEEMIINDFKEAGYEMNVTVLRAADYSVPQKRDRVIFIGNRINKKNYHPKPFLSPSEYVTTGEAIKDLMELNDDIEFNHVQTKHRPDMAQRMLELEEGKSLYKGYSDAWKKCAWDEASCTIKENHGGVNVHPKLPRVLTAREMARIQSFPDDFIFEGPKSKQLVQLGNAVPPLLSKAIGLALRKSYNL
ncbi:DNA cytosine methyltransferase [Flavobacterium sp. K5-23]|uniref:DNA cytosine methyltransferase n=1 Tax=Flavobacterium sp. K5-23 TaxID=2746225 RepID=UPI00200E22B7|nr:DNA cytosine methyltransferase [Flavobacterium sp. K5-23]UQD56266.1 DNA cytosine methyltransferase [Flavobacterium sp. K5-23]